VTLILALRCRDGVVLASDSQATLATSGQATRQDVDKLHLIRGHLGWGGSGSGGLIQRVQEKLSQDQGVAKIFERDGEEQGARRLSAHVNQLQKEAVQSFVGLPGVPGVPEHVAGIFVGVAQGKFFILEIGIQGDRHFVNSHSAIGSGDVFATHAMSCVAHYDLSSLSLEKALALGFRTVSDAIRSAASGIGGAVQLLSVSHQGTRCLPKEEVDPIRDLVDLWKQQEAEVLGQLSRSPNAPEPTEDPPTEESTS